MWEKLRTRAQHQAERLKRELRTYRLLLVDPRTPKTSKWLLGAALAYIMSPIDLIPELLGFSIERSRNDGPLKWLNASRIFVQDENAL